MAKEQIIYITPKFRLCEAENLNMVTLGDDDFLGDGGSASSQADNGEIGVEDIIAQAKSRNTKFSSEHNIDTQSVFSMAKDLLNSKLQGIKYNLIYKLTEGEEDTYGKVDPKKVYDIEIEDVTEDAAYKIFNINNEINGQKIVLNKILRDDLFTIIIESDAYQRRFPGCDFIKGIKVV